MCGIAGTWFPGARDDASLHALGARQGEAIAHRGPDDAGTWADPAAGLVLSHRRLSNYFGRFLRHGNAYPDRVLRLFDRRRGGWRGSREVHEAASVDGPVRTLEGDLLHFPYRSLEQQLAKTQRYARMMAEHDFKRGRRASLVGLVLSPAWRFWRGYLLRAGFLDGWHGLVYAYVRANYVRQKTIMLWMMQNKQPVVEPPRGER